MGTRHDTGPHALLCVDGDDAAGPLVCAFARAGLLTTLAGDPSVCLDWTRTGDHDVVVVAMGGPDCRSDFLGELRKVNHSPLIVLCDQALTPGEVGDLGIHAQMPSGSDPALVAAQARVLLDLLGTGRGSSRGGADTPCTREWGPLTLDLRTRQARWAGAPVELTRLQFGILEALVEAGGAVIPTDTLCERIWNGEPVYDSERLFAHIRRIRSKIEDTPSRPEFLLTVRGVGFRLADPSPEPRRTTGRARAWRGPERRVGDRRRTSAVDAV